MGRRRLRHLWMALPLAALLFIYRALLDGRGLFLRDISRTYWPLKRFIAQAFESGVLPQWWPYDALGMPMVAATLASLFHPTTALFALLPLKLAFAIYVLSGAVAGLWGAQVLGRRLGLGEVSAALAAGVYSLCGWMVSIGEQPFTLLAAGALPWVWWASLRARRAWRAMPYLALAFGLLLLAGDPFQGYLATFSALALAATAQSKRALALLRCASGLLVGAGVAAVQWLPVALLLPHLKRGDTGSGTPANIWSLTPLQLRAFVDSDAVIHLNSYFPSLYLGVPVIALALFPLWSRRRPWMLYGVLLFSLWLALGPAGGLWQLLSAAVPGWSGLRYPLKALLPAMLAAALLAGMGLRYLSRRGPVRHWRWAAPAILALVCGDLAWKHARLHPPTPDGFFQTPSLAQTLMQNGTGLTGAAYYFDGTTPRGSWGEVAAFETRSQHMMVPLRGALHGLPIFNSYLPGDSGRLAQTLREGRPSLAALAVFGVRDVITPLSRFPDRARVHATAVDPEDGWALSRVPGARPRAYLTTQARVFPRQAVAETVRMGQLAPGTDILP
ncbi:MAG: hypothetical protein ACKVPX_07055 [Myxococcaceae bacterium]